MYLDGRRKNKGLTGRSHGVSGARALTSGACDNRGLPTLD